MSKRVALSLPNPKLCSAVGTWTGGVLQVTQAGLFGDAVDELARFAVLVAGGQLQRGQLLHRVLIQHQAFVHHHGRGKMVLWRRGGSRRGGLTAAKKTQKKKKKIKLEPSEHKFINTAVIISLKED